MTRSWVVMFLSILLLVVSAIFGAYYTDSSATMAGQQRSISNLESTVSSLVDHPVTTTATSVAAQTTSVTSVSTATIVQTSTLTSTETIALNSTSGQLGPWNPTTPFPGANSPSSCVTDAGYIYCVGGNANSTFFAPISFGGIGKWTRGTDYPLPVQDEKCVASLGYIYCVGGDSTAPAAQSSDHYGRIADVYYATVSNSGIGAWKKTTPFPYVIPYPRCVLFTPDVYCVAASFDGKGYSNPPHTFFALLSPDGVGNWTQAEGPESMTAGCSAVGGYAYCYGGAPCSPLPPPADCYSPSYSASLSSNGVGNWNSAPQLPTAVFAVYGSAESFVYYFSTPVFYAHVTGNTVGPWETTTNFPDAFSPGACASSGVQIYCAGANKDGTYFALVGAPNPKAFVLQNPPPFPRAQYIVHGSSGSPGCNLLIGETCFGRNIDDAVVFDCASSAATSAGCEVTVKNPTNFLLDYNVTIWYPAFPPYSNANCEILPEYGYTSPAKAWCISVSQTSFIVAEPIEVHPPQSQSPPDR